MDWLREKINFPVWIHPELQKYVQDGREAIEPLATKWNGDALIRWKTHAKAKMKIEERLLTDSRMEAVWKKFEELPEDQRINRMINFLEIAITAQFDGEERRVTGDDNKKVKALKKRATQQALRFIETIREIDEFCSHLGTKELALRSELDEKNSYENQIREIKENLFQQLENYRRNFFPTALAKKVLGRSPKHVLLLHEIDSSVFYIEQLVKSLRAKGWKIIDPMDAYSDPIYFESPKNLYANNGLIAQLAEERGFGHLAFKNSLREDLDGLLGTTSK